MSKKSFFERLTGAMRLEEKDTKASPEKVKKTIKKMAVKKNYLPKETVKQAVETQKAQEEWFSETEGQLTIDVYQTEADIVIKSTIAGVKPEDIDVTITNDMVTIKGSRGKDEDITAEDYYYQECYWGSFSRSVILPVDVEAEKAQASMKNGILTVRLPKVEKVKTRKIRVKSV